MLFPFDEDKYAEIEGLNDIYYKYSCGPKYKTWEKVLEKMFALLKDDTEKTNRENLRKVFHLYNDGNNCRRVFDATMQVMKKKNGFN